MNINQRIKALRKSLKLNQTDFGSRIGLKNGAISKIEQDGGTVVDQNKHMICDKFHISMHWLETGEGDMYAADSSNDIFDSLREELNLSDMEEKILRGYFELDEHSRQSVAEFIINIGKVANKAISSSADKNIVETSPADDDDIELKRRQEIIAAEFVAEKKGRMSTASTFTNGHAKKA